MSRFYVGLDLGKEQDPSAVAVVEKVDLIRGYQTPAFGGLLVRHVGRMPLGTPYPQVVEKVRELVGHAELRGRCGLVVDATGVGTPVVDMLQAARLGCDFCAVKITAGEQEVLSRSGYGVEHWNVPKRDLMAGVQVLLERGELRIAKGMRETGSLVRELMDVKGRQRENGRVRVGAEGCGEHDDLVIAVALAVWKGRKVKRTVGPQGGRLFF